MQTCGVLRWLDAILGHVASRGDRFPVRANRARRIELSTALSIRMWCRHSDRHCAAPLRADGFHGKVAHAQYFGRCEFAHSRACSIGRRCTAARTFCVAGKLSMRSRQRQNAGNFGYIDCPSAVRLKAKVLGSR